MPHVTPIGSAPMAPENWLMAMCPWGHWLGTGGGAHMRDCGFMHSDAPMFATCDALAHMAMLAAPPAPAPALKFRMLGCASAYDLAPTVTLADTDAGVNGFMLMIDGV